MDSRFLTPGQHGQVADFTGAHTKAGQVRVLVRNGIRHTLNAAGWLQINANEAGERMSSSHAYLHPILESRPNLTVLTRPQLNGAGR